jgi:hypothetical protein
MRTYVDPFEGPLVGALGMAAPGSQWRQQDSNLRAAVQRQRAIVTFSRTRRVGTYAVCVYGLDADCGEKDEHDRRYGEQSVQRDDRNGEVLLGRQPGG